MNGCYSFDGTSQYVEVSSDAALGVGSGDFSIDAWIKTSAASGVQPIVDKRSSGPTKGYAFFLNNGYPALQIAVPGASTTYALDDLNGGPQAFVADDHWHLVAVSVDRDNTDGVRFYVDASRGSTFIP